jgi:hypothetical protein
MYSMGFLTELLAGHGENPKTKQEGTEGAEVSDSTTTPFLLKPSNK